MDTPTHRRLCVDDGPRVYLRTSGTPVPEDPSCYLWKTSRNLTPTQEYVKHKFFSSCYVFVSWTFNPLDPRPN